MALYRIIRPVYIVADVEADSALEAEEKEFDLWCKAGGENLPNVDPNRLTATYEDAGQFCGAYLTTPGGNQVNDGVGIHYLRQQPDGKGELRVVPQRSEAEKEADIAKGKGLLTVRS